MSNYKTHAEREFRAAGWTNPDGTFKDEMQGMICKHVLALLDVFADEGHSGSSAPYALNLFKQLASFEPVVPLSGDDDEWNDVGDGVFQNNRCSHVFKQPDRFNGQAYDIEAVIFWEWYESPLDPNEEGYPGTVKTKSHFTSGDSAQPITFPYTPVRRYEERKP